MSSIIIKWFENQPLFQRFITLLQRIKLGKHKIGLYEAIKIFLKKLSNPEILDRTNAVAYSFTVAIFPGIIFLFTLTPYIQNVFPEITNDDIIHFLENLLPENLYLAAETTIYDIISKQRGGLLSFNFILTLFLATNGMTSLMSAFNASYKTKETRGFIRMRMIATFLLFMLSLSIIIAIGLLIVGQQLLEVTHLKENIEAVISLDTVLVLRVLVIYLSFQFSISCIYYFAPAVHERWHFLSIGSVFAAIACILSSVGFSYYVNNFGTYNKLYGSIGVIIVLMLWLYILSLILLVGYEMNAAIDTAKREKLNGESEEISA
jgi:membrane protein